jgi:hypothetical protein
MMRSRRPKYLVRALAVSFPLQAAALVGCQGEPVDPEAMSRQAAHRAAEVVRSSAQALKANEGAEGTVEDTSRGFDVVTRTLNRVPIQPTAGTEPSTVAPPPPGPMPKDDDSRWRRLAGRYGLQSLTGAFRSEAEPASIPTDGVAFTRATMDDSLADDLNSLADELEKLIRDRLLASANLESKSDSEAIYHLKPDPTCRDLETQELDEGCVEQLTKVEFRVRLTRDGDGSRLDVLVGSSRVHPGSFFVHEGQIAVEIYLAELKQALAVSAQALGEPDDSPEVMKGKLRVVLKRDGIRKVSFSLSFLEIIELHDTQEPFVIRTAAANPALALAVDGDAGQISGSMGLGTTEVVLPWEPNGESASGSLEVVVGGLTGQYVYNQTTRQAKASQVGLGSGPSYAQVRGQRIFQVDLNATDGRAFDLTITPSSSGMPRLAITPRFDLSIMWKLGLVASDFQTPPPSYLLDETYHLTADPADGAGPVLEPFEEDASGNEGGIRVVSGKVSLASSKAAAPVTAVAGQCLVSGPAGAGEHPVLGTLQVKTCP